MEYAASDSSGGSILPFILIAGLFVLTYFMVIRPQGKRRREMAEMQAAIAPGAWVVTIGGLYGKVSEVDEETVYLEVAEEVEVRFARAAIARVLTDEEVARHDAGVPEVDENVVDDVVEEELADDKSASDGESKSSDTTVSKRDKDSSQGTVKS